MEEDFELNKQKILVVNDDINIFLINKLPKLDLENLLNNKSIYNTGIFESNFENTKDDNWIYLTFAYKLEYGIQFILYRLFKKGETPDRKDVIFFSSYCASLIKMDIDQYKDLIDLFFVKISLSNLC